MAPHAAAARGATLFAPCEDELNNWPRGHPADGSDDDYGLKADGASSQKAAAFLELCAEEPDGDRRAQAYIVAHAEPLRNIPR